VSGVAAKKGAGARLVQASALVVIFGILLVATQLAPASRAVVGTVAGLGFLLLAGTLMSELVETIGLPHLSGYLLAGLIAGPHALHLVDHVSVERLSVINALALALIAIAGGAELRLEQLRESARSLAWGMLVQCAMVGIAAGVTFVALARFLPFTRGLPPVAVFGVALLWGTLAMTRSPSAVLGILTQLRPKGPLTTYTLAFVMASDVILVVVLALVMSVVRVLVDPSAALQLSNFEALGHELLGSTALGTTLGIVLGVYLRFVGKQLLVVLVGLGFGMTELLRYVHLDPLLSFMVAGFVVQNFTAQGAKLLHAVEEAGALVFVVFFATAGAHLDLPLLFSMWPIALALAGVRAVVTVLANRVSARIADDPPVIRTWGWSGLVSQAGLTIGFTIIIERAFPEFGEGFRNLAIGVVALNEMAGPVLFKLGLDRTGETKHGAPAAEAAHEPPAAAAS
jgi:Kef-type K+ transport system membrane component KefB